MNQTLVKILQSDDQLKLKGVYNEYRTPFLQFGRKYNLDQDTLTDIYQEAFIALRKHAMQGTLDSVQSSMKTYLFGIAKFMIFDTLKKNKREIPYDSHLHIANEKIDEIPINTEESLTEEQKILRQYFKKLGKKCQELLTFFYYRGLTIEEIVEKGGYNSQNVVKAQKSRCLKTLKEMINS